MTNIRTPSVYKVIVAQLMVTAFIAAISLLLSGTIVAYSILIGGLISALPNSYFALQAFKYQGASNADRVVKSFIRGELGKIGITLVLFALSFTLITNLVELALILGFITIHFTGVMVSAFINYSPVHPQTKQNRLNLDIDEARQPIGCPLEKGIETRWRKQPTQWPNMALN